LNNTQVFQVPKANFAITAGEPKIFTKQSDHGRVSRNQARATITQYTRSVTHKIAVVLTSYLQDIHTHFCPRCGTALFRTGGAPAMADFIGLRAGVLGDQTILDKAPMMEVYVERRMKWLKPVDGAMQMDAQYHVVQ
jgi:hypothetical protein